MTNDVLHRRMTSLVRSLTRDAHPVTISGHLAAATLDREAGPLIGHVMLDMLEEAGFGPLEVDAVGGWGPQAGLLASAILHAAASRGLEYDGFMVSATGEDVSMIGPDVSGKRVVLVCTDSASCEEAHTFDTLEEAGASVEALAVLVEMGSEAREVAERLSIPYAAVVTLEQASR